MYFYDVSKSLDALIGSHSVTVYLVTGQTFCDTATDILVALLPYISIKVCLDYTATSLH